MSGTRQKPISDVFAWANSPGESESHHPVFWMYGFAGAGKTAIAQSIATLARQEGRLLASFLFSRTGDAARRDFSHLLPTIMYQIAMVDKDYLCRIAGALSSDRDIRDKQTSTQISVLVKRPFANSNSIHPPPLIVIDALDECDHLDDPKVSRALGLLFRSLASLPLGIRLFITSRDEQAIQRLFHDPDLSGHRTMVLHYDIEERLVQADISHYIRRTLADIALTHGLDPDLFPSEDQVKELERRSGSAFVYAATLMRYVSQGPEDPMILLEYILSRNPVRSAEQHELIDDLYTNILIQSIKMSSRKSYDRLPDLRAILSVLVVTEEELDGSTLAVLSGVSLANSDVLLNKLRSIFMPQPYVRPFHLSFFDYIVDTGRCDDKRLLLDLPHSHALMAERCLDILNVNLRYNICDIELTSMNNRDVRDLSERVQRLPREVRYAATFWPVHVRFSCGLDKGIMQQLELFCHDHILHWIELLSVMNALISARQSLPLLRDMLLVCESLSLDHSIHTISDLHAPFSQLQPSAPSLTDCVELLADTYRTILEYWPALSNYALHIYHSALVTMPICKLQLRYDAIQRAPGPRLKSARNPAWQPFRDIRVFDQLQAKEKLTIKCLTGSPSGKFCASGDSLGSVTLWNVWSGGIAGSFRMPYTTASRIVSLVLSPNDVHVAATDEVHGWTYIWNINTGEIVQSLKDFSYRGYPSLLSFSADGSNVLLCSRNRITTIVVETGVLLQVTELSKWPALSLRVIRVSHNCGHVAAIFEQWSPSSSIHVWDMQTGAMRHTLVSESQMGDQDLLIEFSHDGRYMGTARQLSQSVSIWDMRKGSLIRNLPDIQYHNVDSGIQSTPHVFAEMPIGGCLSFSASGDLLASASKHGQRVFVWSIQTGQVIFDMSNVRDTTIG
jgi:hypothetical protein